MQLIKITISLVLFLLAAASNFAEETEIESSKTYENCTVYESMNSFTDERMIVLQCINESEDFGPNAYMSISSSADESSKRGWLEFKTDDIFLHMYVDIKVKYRFDKEEVQENWFDYDAQELSANTQVSQSRMDTTLKWISKSDKLVMDLGGKASATINLDGSKEAVKDFKERMEKLKPSEDDEESVSPDVLFNTAIENSENPRVTFDTSQGNFMVELYPDKAPLTVQHFLKLIDDDYYDGLIFHRVIKDFVIQTGSFNQEHEHQSVEESVKNEAKNGLSNKKGTLAMARGEDPDSATSDFYINLTDNLALDREGRASNPHGYTVFGKVIRGMDVVEKIGRVETETKKLFQYDWENFPVDDVVIKQASTSK